MQQTLHLLIVDVERRAAMAATYGSRWLLPVVSCGERMRAGPLVARWLADRGLAADVAGQWLGRVTLDAIDWLVAIVAKPGSAVAEAALQWRSIDALTSSAAVIEYQHWALVRALATGSLPSASGPFGHLSWPADVRAWIGHAMGSEVSAVTPYRVGAHEVVLGADCASGRVYFKGLTGERAVEADVTQALAALEPESFARTLAFQRRPDGAVWWLTAACNGRPAKDVDRVATALALIQQRVLATRVRCQLARLDLIRASEWAGTLLGESAHGDAVRRSCTHVMRADVPASWIPMDLDPSNILIDDDNQVRFIDVDDSFIGPAPLAMAVPAMRSEGKLAFQLYEQSWSPPLIALNWSAFETAATVVQFWLGWRRFEQHVARGELFVDRGFAAVRTRDRLVKVLDGRSLSQARPDGHAA